MRPPRLEKSIEKAVVDYAKKRGCLVRKMNGMGARSWPDRMFITPTGRVFFIEFKRPGGKLTEGQAAMLDDLRGRHVGASVEDDVVQGKQIVDWNLGLV
jgi:hypothetical protein